MRTSRKLSIVLTISLALNLFLGGAFVSHWMSGDTGKRGGFRGPLHHTAAREKLSSEHQGMVDNIWQQHRPMIRENIGAMRDARRVVRSTLIADPFDRTAMDNAYADLHQRLLEARSAMAKTIGDVAEKLPATERQAYFKEGFRRFRHRRHMGGRGER
ncbi:MAG: periplasmic heavy metal sensor [Rhodospirillales bacterium]|jgi:uncharacterized membrane protein|nr:periplasmic heavy metal sensor [Rhodospirillales bacterium]